MPNIPGKLPQQTPFSIDQRDPYWQTRIFTPEAGALALEKLAYISKATPPQFEHYFQLINGPVTDAAPVTVRLDQPDGWWQLQCLVCTVTPGAASDAQAVFRFEDWDGSVNWPFALTAVETLLGGARTQCLVLNHAYEIPPVATTSAFRVGSLPSIIVPAKKQLLIQVDNSIGGIDGASVGNMTFTWKKVALSNPA